MRFEVNLSILFTELPLLERPAAAKEAGFDAVEFWWPWPVAVPVGRRGRPFVARGHRRRRAAGRLNFFAGDMPGGDRGLVSWPARSAEFRDNIDVTVGIGERLGCRAFNALYGNRIDDSTPEEQDALAAENLALAARAAQRIGGTVLVEPVSGAPRYPLLTAADALAAIDRVAASRQHRAAARPLPPRGQRRRRRRGDRRRTRAGSGTCRSPTPRAATSPAPGSSTSTATCDRIAATGYDGWVGLEYKPTGASADAFDWLPARAPRRPADIHRFLTTRRGASDMTTVAFIGLGIMGGPMAAQPGQGRLRRGRLQPQPGQGRSRSSTPAAAAPTASPRPSATPT